MFSGGLGAERVFYDFTADTTSALARTSRRVRLRLGFENRVLSTLVGGPARPEEILLSRYPAPLSQCYGQTGRSHILNVAIRVFNA